MTKNITYLLGAGASINSIPTINGMNERMTIFSRFLKTQKEKGTLKHDYTDTFIENLDRIIQEEKKCTSIDAYAKELYHQSRQSIEYVCLKSILSSYLIFEQLIKPNDIVYFSENKYTGVTPSHYIKHSDEVHESINTVIDKRYKTFFLDIDSAKKIPDNVNILSWNYDMQIEAAYSHLNKVSLEYAQQELQVFPSNNNIDTKKSCIIKLNGTAGLSKPYPYNKFSNWFDLGRDNLMDALQYLIEIYKVNSVRAMSNPQLYFAWENEDASLQTRKYAKEIIEKTNILIVIGYSFPRFNNNIDKQIFSNISRLERLHYQAPSSDVQNHINNLKRINPKMFAVAQAETAIDRFYIPEEL